MHLKAIHDYFEKQKKIPLKQTPSVCITDSIEHLNIKHLSLFFPPFLMLRARGNGNRVLATLKQGVHMNENLLLPLAL